MNDLPVTEAIARAELDKAPNEPANKRRQAEHLAQVKQVLKSKQDSPLRHLAMPDLGAITDITLAEFDELRRRVVECQDLYAIPKSPKFATLAETICRACHLLFALVESGGLCMSHPERAIEEIKIDACGALGGYLRWSGREPQRKIEAGKQPTSNSDNDEEHDASTSGCAGPRHHLYTLGHAHLMTFVYYRVKKGEACDGDLLLPPLPSSLGELKRDAAGQLTWLKNFKGKVEWRRIFRFWLNTQLSDIRHRNTPLPAPVSWTSIAHLALWRILPRERRALLLAARQNLVATSPLPDSKINDLLAHREIRYRKINKKERIAITTTANLTSQSSQAEYARLGLEQTETALLDVDETSKENAVESKRDVDRQQVIAFLATLKTDDTKKVEVIKAAKSLADSAELICDADDDLRYLLRWVSTLLRTRKELSTAHTYASRVIRAMHAFDDKPLSRCTTEDIAAYLENYESPNSVRNVRGTLEDFDNYLIESKGASPGRINWQDRSLLAYEQYRERDCITEDEYRRVREAVIHNASDEPLRLRRLSLLTLLGRCGLRADEAAWLASSNFLGWTQARLLVIRSKTRAGRKRMLPLYLLLDEQEQDEVRRYVSLCKSENAKRFLFANDKGERVTAHALGRETEALLRAGGVQSETAHGLRHAFATGLFAAWWLQLTGSSGDAAMPNASWARRALEMYGRPGIESRAVSHAYHIQLLLGHADLRVTFDRYIHVVDLACADAVMTAENRQACCHTMRLTHAARLIGMDDKELRSAVHESQRQNAGLDLSAIRPLLRGRIANLDSRQFAITD